MNKIFDLCKTTAIAALLAGAANAGALEATIAWNPVTQAVDGSAVQASGYRLYYGTASGSYDQYVDVDGSSATLTNLVAGQQYFFAAKTVANGVESGFSTELAWTAPDTNAPAIEPIVATEGLVEAGAGVFVAAGFNDAQAGDTHVAEWAWGDGSTSAGDVDETNQIVFGSHAYAAAGVYPITLGLMDAAGAMAVAEGGRYVVAYDPNSAYVAGEGQVDLPEGRASFGFTAAAAKGRGAANAEVRFKLAGLELHGTVCDQLVVKGKNGSVEIDGSGLLNGTQACSFTLVAADGATDTFGIRIWTVDASGTQTTVYDSGTDLPLADGSVVIQAK